MDFKVGFYRGSDYAVYKKNENGGYIETPDGVAKAFFIGSLADCEAWIRLTLAGYLD